MSDDAPWTPATTDTCETVAGPFLHGTKALLDVGDALVRRDVIED